MYLAQNIILNVFALGCALVGTYYCDKVGRRPNALIATVTLTICLYLVGVLTQFYGESTNTSAIYATVAMIFLFQGTYSFGWTPLCYTYPPEVVNYKLRPLGMAVNTFTFFGVGLVLVLCYRFAMEAMGWTAHIMNASWNLPLIAFIYFFWVETKGKTLEEIDALFEEGKHTDVPDLQLIEAGKVEIEGAGTTNEVVEKKE